MAINGEITRTDDNAFTGWIASLTFDQTITLTPNPHKAKDKHPDFEISAKSPNGRYIRIGSAWEAESQAGNYYLSIVVNAGSGDVRVNALLNEGSEDTFRLVPYAS